MFSRSQRIFSAAGKSKSGIVSATMHFSRGGIIDASVSPRAARFTSSLFLSLFYHRATSNATDSDAAPHYAESQASATRHARLRITRSWSRVKPGAPLRFANLHSRWVVPYNYYKPQTKFNISFKFPQR